MKCIETVIETMKLVPINEVSDHATEFTQMIKTLSAEKENRVELNDGSHELCNITMHLVYAAYQLGTICDLVGVYNAYIAHTYERLNFLIRICLENYNGVHHRYQLSNTISGHNHAFEDYLAKALPEAGMEETIPIGIASLCAGYSATVRCIADTIRAYEILLGYGI